MLRTGARDKHDRCSWGSYIKLLLRNKMDRYRLHGAKMSCWIP